MSYEIVRVEKTKDRQGNDEVFAHIQYLDEKTGTIVPFAKWLSQGELSEYLKNESYLESTLIPKWLPYATKQYEDNKAFEEASRFTMAKAIAALVDSGALVKSKEDKFTQEQVTALEEAAKSISQDKVDVVVSSTIAK